MKVKLFALLTVICVAISSCYDDTALLDRLENHEQRIYDLETLCKEMNTNITSLQALLEVLQTNDCITSIAPIMEGSEEVGYVINFANHNPITIYHGKNGKDGVNGTDGKDGQDGINGADGKDGQDGQNGKDGVDGKDGHSPVIGVRKDVDGVYYWTLDGEWLYDVDGNKIKAVGTDGKDGVDGADGADGTNGKDGVDGTDGKDGVDGTDGKDGITPSLKIEEGYWYVSYDNGQTWQQLYKAVGEDGKNGADGKDGKDGDSFFKSVIVESASVTFILADGQTFSIPMFQKINIKLDVVDNETIVRAGETIYISYELENVTDETLITAGSDGNYKVRIKSETNTRGKIEVDCPCPYVDGFINVTVSDGYGNSYVKSISFQEKKMTLADGYECSVQAEGGNVYIPFEINFDYNLKVADEAASWISTVATKATMRYDNINLSIARNNNTAARKGVVYVYADNNPDQPYMHIIINQASAVFTLEKTNFVVKAEGDTLSTVVYSTSGLSVKTESLPQWLAVEMTPRMDERTYDVNMTVDANAEDSKRAYDLVFYADDNLTELGFISLVQLDEATNSKLDMVFKVRANFANDFTIRLPLDPMSKMDCFVDWGDGTVEHHNNIQYEAGEMIGSIPVPKHRYEGLTEGKTFEVRISGRVEGLKEEYSMSNDIDHVNESGVIEVVQWGNTGLKNMYRAFLNNKNLTKLPSDDMMAFADVYGFEYAFFGCSGLETLPEGLFKYCTETTSFNYAFEYCTGLKTLPEDLFESCTSARSFYYTFAYCENLQSLPKTLFADCINATNFTYCFTYCNSLTAVPEDFFAANINANSFDNAFYNCESLKTLPANLFSHCENVTSFRETFAFCPSLQTIPSSLFANCVNVSTFEYCFHNTGLKSIPSALFSDCVNVKSMARTFLSCSNLTSIPVSLFDNNRRVSDFSGTFMGCNNLVGQTPYTEIKGVKYHLYDRADAPDYFVAPNRTSECFSSCYNLTDWNQIPDSWKYMSM